MPMRARRTSRAAVGVLAALVAALVAGCATVTPEDSAWIDAGHASPRVEPQRCPVLPEALVATTPLPATRPLRLVSWNIHKNGDAGWDRDLERLSAGADLVLLQEAALTPELRALLAREQLPWIMADAWRMGNLATGVLTAARAPASGSCVSRMNEPLLGVPKSALVSYYRLEGRSDLLAVGNVHAVNFSLMLTEYRVQLEALAAVLAPHRGPMILAGDFNTWSLLRTDFIDGLAQGLGLRRLDPGDDHRTRFLGLPFDHLYVRGFDPLVVGAEPVTSSDHAPVFATLSLSPEAR